MRFARFQINPSITFLSKFFHGNLACMQIIMLKPPHSKVTNQPCQIWKTLFFFYYIFKRRRRKHKKGKKMKKMKKKIVGVEVVEGLLWPGEGGGEVPTLSVLCKWGGYHGGNLCCDIPKSYSILGGWIAHIGCVDSKGIREYQLLHWFLIKRY